MPNISSQRTRLRSPLNSISSGGRTSRTRHSESSMLLVTLEILVVVAPLLILYVAGAWSLRVDYASGPPRTLAAGRNDWRALCSGWPESWGRLLGAARRTSQAPICVRSRVHVALPATGFRRHLRGRGVRPRGPGRSLSPRSGDWIPCGVVEHSRPSRVLGVHGCARACE
jgi:hypothetical protein